jgi:hypothetical protein
MGRAAAVGTWCAGPYSTAAALQISQLAQCGGTEYWGTGRAMLNAHISRRQSVVPHQTLPMNYLPRRVDEPASHVAVAVQYVPAVLPAHLSSFTVSSTLPNGPQQLHNPLLQPPTARESESSASPDCMTVHELGRQEQF